MSSDHKYFNCSEEHEVNYVANRYKSRKKVYDFLKEKCKDGTIKNFTHQQVYDLIKEELGLSIGE